MAEAGPSSLAAAPNYAGQWSRLKPRLHPVLEEHVATTMGFEQMTPVQSSVIPLFLSHKDVIVEAVTGSGKTLAYVLPVLHMLHRRNTSETASGKLKRSQVGALIVCPTRELAIQVHGVIVDILRLDASADEPEEAAKMEAKDEPGHAGPQLAVSAALLAVGGSTSSPADDYRAFRTSGADIVVGTPGRIEELMKRTSVDVKDLEVLILDEADRLLDMGFQQSISNIIQMLPKQRRTGLFSATMTDGLSEMARVGLRNPVRVVVKVEAKRHSTANGATNEKRMPATLESSFLAVHAEHKMLQLLRLLRKEVQRPQDELPMRKAIVYFATCAQVDYFYKVLSQQPQCAGLKLYSLHGKQIPTRRRATYDSFVSATPMGSASSSTEEQASVLLCTDVAARGLDLPSVDLVVQYDPPTDPKVFSHRCGRTARAGRRGRAIVLLQEGREEDYVEFLRVRKSPVRPYIFPTHNADANGQDSKAQDGKAPDRSAAKEDIDEAARSLHQGMRKSVQADRALYELGMQAFVSFVQAYRKHEVSFVFREKDLDLASIAFAYGLMHLPSMPEVAAWSKRQQALGDAAPKSILVEQRIDMDTFAYADKLREKQRLATREAAIAKRKQISDAGNTEDVRRKKRPATAPAWSDQTARKERRQERRDKKQRKRAFLTLQQGDDAEKKGIENDNNDVHSDDDDVDDWAAEEREEKKAKRALAAAKGQAAARDEPEMAADLDFGDL